MKSAIPKKLVATVPEELVRRNTRVEISQNTLGIPVIAIGIPTVVELATLVSEGIDIFIKILQEKSESNDYLNELQKEDKYEEVKEALNVGEYNMIVTPNNPFFKEYI